ncbi:uncharacterized protein LOC135479023 [Liolophura sinensis]|uniref:uncharacterized protein LOC135479023 n=1 Tax=Liolophura sinensis TaxID=3198878 RepID=UPI0031594EBD
MKVKRVVFPSDQANWCRVRVLLRQLKEHFLREDCDLDKCAQFHQEMYEVNASNPLSEKGGRAPQNCIMYGLFRFLQDTMDAEERSHVVKVTLPFVIDTALQIEKHIPHGGLCMLEQHVGKTVELSRKLVSSILACALLCLFPERVRDKTAKLNFINFTNFFEYLTSSSQQAKLRGILHYFDRLREIGGEIKGSIIFSRQVMNKEDIPSLESWLDCDTELCELVVDQSGSIEKAGCDTLQISFSNSFIGGGVLLHGRAQEEIRFSMCPELLSSLLFTERMLDSEAVLIKGFEQFTQYEGYASSLVYSADHRDQAERDQSGNLQTALCAIDAASYKLGTKERQYREGFLLRDLNKALVGFKLCEERYNTLKASRSVTKLEQSSSEEDYHTAPENASNEVSDNPHLPSSLLSLAVELSEDVLSTAVKQAAALQQNRRMQHSEVGSTDEDKNGNKSFELSDFGQAIDLSSSPIQHHTGPELLGVCLDDFLSDGRRRSSNLSDLASRRSSSSTKYSSEFSSEFEEYYDSFQKQDQRHCTIKEEVGSSSLMEFANLLAEKLLQEGSCAAAHSFQAVQTFNSIPLPTVANKPIPIRAYKGDTQKDLQSVIPEKSASVQESFSPVSHEAMDRVSSNIVDDLVQIASKEVDQFWQESENNNIVERLGAENQPLQSSQQPHYSVEDGQTGHEDLPPEESSPATLVNYANSLAKIILNLALRDLAQRQHDCDVCRERASSVDFDQFAPKIADNLSEDAKTNAEHLDKIFHEDVKHAKLGLILAEKIVHEIMTDLRNDSQSRTKLLEALKTCDNVSKEAFDSSHQSRQKCVAELENYNSLADHLLTSCFEGAKDEITKSFHDTKSRAIDFCEVVDVQHVPEIDHLSLEEEMFNYAQAFTDNIISDACREVNRGWLLKSHSRRSSEPSQKTNSIHAFMNGGLEKRSASPSGRGYHHGFSIKMSRWHSNEEVSRQKRGFQDEMLSSLDELLQRSNPYIPSLELFRSERRGSLYSDQGSSRRSSCSGFRDSLLASFEEELILTSADRNASMSSTSSNKGKKSHNRSSMSLSPRSNHEGAVTNCKHLGKNSRSEAELDGLYLWDEAAPESDAANEKGGSRILLLEETDDGILDRYACCMAGDVVKTAVTLSSEEPFLDASDIPYQLLEDFSNPLATNILSSAVAEAASVVKSKQSQDCKKRMRAIATGNWGCGVLGGDPQLKAMIQWAAASYARAPTLLYFTFSNQQVAQLNQVQSKLRARGWTVGNLMTAVNSFCERTLEQYDRDELPSSDLFQELLRI